MKKTSKITALLAVTALVMALAACSNPSGSSGSTRIRFPTAFAKDSGVYQSTTENYGGFWWQRSPNPDCNNRDYYVHTVESSGDARHNNTVGYDNLGVVPALCLN